MFVTPPNTPIEYPSPRQDSSQRDLAAFYGCVTDSDSTTSSSEDENGTLPSKSQPQATNNGHLKKRHPEFTDIVKRGYALDKVSKQFKTSLEKMDIKREGKGSTDKLVEAFMKSEMKKNSSYNDLAKDRIDSGNKRNGGVSPDISESEITLLKNPKKIAVFEGILSDDLPPLNSKIVRIFTSSTFTGILSLFKFCFILPVKFYYTRSQQINCHYQTLFLRPSLTLQNLQLHKPRLKQLG